MNNNYPVYEKTPLATSKLSVVATVFNQVALEPYWHFHPELELTMIQQGSGIRFVGDSIENYRAGDLVLVGQNLPHQWVSKETNNGLLNQSIVIKFQIKPFEDIYELRSLLLFLQSAKAGYHFTNLHPTLIQRIQQIPEVPLPLRIGQLIEILYELQSHTVPRRLSKTTKFNISDSSKEQKKINEAICFIVNNLKQKLTVSRMADKCCMVPQAFCRWFRKHTGFSFIAYLNKTRIESACQYLLTSNMPIKLIAYEVGYENVSHFNRTFKKHTGISPLVFKKRHL